MSRLLHTVSVFIASPGDVADERETVRHAIELVNRLVARPNGVLFESIGWEDIPAGKGHRAQDVINPFVDKADIFIGLLARRFGTPNGIAESGTHEEYQRAAERWGSESPKPDVKIYFRKLTPRDLREPSEQLQEVLKFKESIAPTDLYHEFADEDALEQRIENDLSAWVYERVRGGTLPATSQLHGMSPADLTALATLLDGSWARIDHELSDRLVGAGLAKPSGESYALTNATDGFVAIAKHLNVPEHRRTFLQSRYFSEMMRAHIKNVIQARYHVALADDEVDVLRQLAILSPSVTSYLLTGDTSLYDNLSDHARKIGQHEYATTMLQQNLVHQALVAYATDAINGVVLDAVDGKSLAGQSVGVELRAVFEDGGLLRLASIVPSIRAKFEGPDNAEKGQMMSAAAPEFFIRSGTVFIQLGLFQQAIAVFRTALRHELPAEGRAAALNNLGLALMNIGNKDDARRHFVEAAGLNPGSPEIKNNIKLLEV